MRPAPRHREARGAFKRHWGAFFRIEGFATPEVVADRQPVFLPCARALPGGSLETSDAGTHSGTGPLPDPAGTLSWAGSDPARGWSSTVVCRTPPVFRAASPASYATGNSKRQAARASWGPGAGNRLQPVLLGSSPVVLTRGGPAVEHDGEERSQVCRVGARGFDLQSELQDSTRGRVPPGGPGPATGFNRFSSPVAPWF